MNKIKPTKRYGVRKWLNGNTIGLAILALVFCASLVRVLTVEKQLFPSDKKVIRISHWELELGYREALQSVIDEYERLHPDVKIVQIPVMNYIYPQWLNIGLISGTAPDLVERGIFKITIDSQYLSIDSQYLSRFFIPLTELVEEPNPYNKNTPLANLPWRETFVDGMQGGYDNDMQDYFSIPSTILVIRLFYNKNILREATGSDEPPKTFQQLMDTCDAIRKLGQRKGKQIVPIAGSKHTFRVFRDRYVIPFTAAFEDKLDLDLNGEISATESYIGFLRGQVTMRTPEIVAYYECLKTLCGAFPEGFLSIGRQQAQFLFVQGNAAMVATGSWDAMSLARQADFEIGIIDFPIPAKNERWGQYIAGRQNEARAVGAIPYGVYKFSKHKEEAIDFLRFLTSLKHNEMLNNKAEMSPIVVGAQVPERRRPFVFNPQGFISFVDFGYGNYARMIAEGETERFLGGETDDYQEFASKIEAALRSPSGGDRAWAIDYDTKKRWCRNQERILAVQSVRMLMDPQASDAASKYRKVLLGQVRASNGEKIRHQFETIRGKAIPRI